MKNRTENPRSLWQCILSLGGLMLLFVPLTLFAQSCSLCYTQAAASTARFIQALRSGILILMLPPMGLSIVDALIAYKRRNRFYQH
jgi:hypothetical protein